MPAFNRHLLRSFLAALCVAALLSGCAEMAARPSPVQQAAANHAQTLYRQGDFDGAAQAWVQLADANRGMRATWLLRAAEAYREENAWQRAAPVLERIQRRRLTPDQAQRYDLLSGEAKLASGDAADALSATNAMLAFPAALQLRVLELRARAQAASGKPLAAARTRLTMDGQLHGFDRDQNEKKLLAVLAGADSARLQQRAQTLPANDPLRPWLTQALAEHGLALAKSLPQLDHPVGTLLPGVNQVDAREGYQPPHRIALLLPAGGPLNAAAMAVDDGFNAAAHADPQRSAVTKVAIYDSAGTPAGAIAAYHHAVANGADIVVGPLSRAAVSALFQQDLPVRVLALNQADSGLPPANSAEFALPPEAEAAQVAAHMAHQGIHSAIMFIAEGDWAQRAARAFRAQFKSLGGQVLGSATLPVHAVNYASAIKTISANAGVDTGVFLALRPRQGRLLVPQMEIAGLKLPIYATSHIYGAEDNPGLDRDLDGVQFADAPWLFGAQPGIPQRSELKSTANNTVGPAARLFAFGMDAWSLLPYLDWLREHPGSYLGGATGQLTMDSFGRVRRTPIWAHFVNGIAVPITGSLNASSDSGH